MKKAIRKKQLIDDFEVVIYREKSRPYDYVAQIRHLPEVEAYGKSIYAAIQRLDNTYSVFKQSADVYGDI